MIKRKSLTYDYAIFSVLVYEPGPELSKRAVIKIKRKLKYYSLGKYDEKRVAYIWKLINEVYCEIMLRNKSTYYHKSDSEYAALNDYDFPRMKGDYLVKYPLIADRDIGDMLRFSIHIFYEK